MTLWRKKDGRWTNVARTTSGRTGYGGLVAKEDRKQGTGTTPLGTYRLLSIVRHPRPRRQLGDVPPQDPLGRLLGAGQPLRATTTATATRARAGSAGGCRASDPNSSERLTDYPKQYEFSIVTGFNYGAQVRHRGSGIFLHVNGTGATAGCVSAPRAFIVKLMNRLEPALRPADRDRPLGAKDGGTMAGSEIRAEIEGRTLKISNLEKVLYPATGTTKGEVLDYYARISPVLLPHLADRAVTRIRWPHGVQAASFFEKNAPAGAPSLAAHRRGADHRLRAAAPATATPWSSRSSTGSPR